MTGQQGQRLAERLLVVTFFSFNQVVSRLAEQGNDLVIDFGETLNDLSGGCLDYLFGLRHSNFYEFNTGFCLNLLNQADLLMRIKRNADACSPSPSRPTGSVDVRLGVRGRFDLYN